MVNFIDCGRSDFVNRVKNKKVYCFGAGKYFKDFFNEQYGIKVEAIIDNFCYMENKNLIVNSTIIDIISMDVFKEIYDSSCAVVITCLAFEDILCQLDSMEQFENMDCYIELFIRNYTEHQEVNIENNCEKELIPKKIHYCWFGGLEIPDEYKKNIESWKKYCPDYEIIRWDETNYDVRKNNYIRQAYDSRKWAFVSDYARVDILYHEGGLYFDTDVEIIKPFDEFLRWNMFCGFESTKFVSWGVGFGSVAGEKILKEVLDVYEHMSFLQEDGSCNMITCPVIQSNILEQNGFRMDGSFQMKDGIAVYPQEYFSPIKFIRGFGRITDSTHSIHHYSASWTNTKQMHYRLKLEKKIAAVHARNQKFLFEKNCTKKSRQNNLKYFQIWEELDGYHHTAGTKAPADIKAILEKLGYSVIAIHPYREEKGIHDWSYKRLVQDWENCYNRIPENAVLILQHPFWQEQKERNDTLLRLKKEKHIKIISIVHDVEKLRGIFLGRYMQSEFDFMMQVADTMIIHNEKMMRYFTELGFDKKRLVSLQIFDYLCEMQENKATFERSVTIAGNLQMSKSPYIGKLHELVPLKVHLYGSNYEEKFHSENVIYHGSFSAEKIPQVLNRGFGLVWDGDSLEKCSGFTGEYLKYNNPHKLSLYLVAGLPIIIWKEAAEAEFVEKHGLGFVVDSLYGIQEILNNIDEKKYNSYLKAVKKISEKLVEGEYTKLALKRAEEILNV